MADLETFLDGRKLVARARAHPILAEAGTRDAAVGLGHLASAGLIAPAQIEVMREQFRASQAKTLNGLLEAALRKGLLQAGQREAAVRGFDAECFRITPREYVIAAGLMTAEQAGTAPSSGGAASGAMALLRTWGRGPKIAAAALLGTLVIACGCCVPFGLVVFRADITTEGTMNRTGSGVMTFTNSGRAAGSMCGRVEVFCGTRTYSSARFCSGNVEPGESLNVPFGVPGMTEPFFTTACEWDFDPE